MKKLGLILSALIISGGAFAQQPQLAPGQVLGNDTASQRNARAADLTAIFDRAFSPSQGSVFNRGPTVWASTRTPVLGLAGTATGTLGFCGVTSGCMTVSPQSVAGTGTLLLPNQAGTIVSGAASPLVSSSTTGVVSCPTCVTSSGGGAITGAVPISVSGAGVVSITGSALTKTDDTNVTLTLGGSAASALVAPASLTLGWTGQLGLTRGGTNASLTASNGGIVWSNATQLQILAGTATAGQMLRSGATAAPSWSTATWPATTTANQILYSSSANVVAGLTTANNGVLNTSSGGVPSITSAPVLGVNGGSGGQITLNGATSGSSVLRVAAAAGTSVFQFPVGNGTGGQVLSTDGAGNTSWIATGGTGTVTNVATAGIVTGGPITTTGTVNVNATITPQGRVTLTSGSPVMSASVTNATRVYWSPYVGNLIPIYDGTNFVPTAFSEVFQDTTDTTKSPAAVTTNSNYDVFCWVDTGPTNRCTRGPLWSSNTSRGTGAGTSELTRVNGILVNAQAITNGPAAQRGTYVATIRSNASSQINYIWGGSATAGDFGVWNAYNRVNVISGYTDGTASWTTAVSATGAPLNATNNARHSAIFGLAEDGATVEINIRVLPNTNVSSAAQIGCVMDSTTGFDKVGYSSSTSGGAQTNQMIGARCQGNPQLGYHFWQAQQAGDGTANATIYGGQSMSYIANFRM